MKIQPELVKGDGKNRNWSRSESMGMARNRCATCHGLGLVDVLADRGLPCSCVLRGIFRACYAKFRACAQVGIGIGNGLQCVMHREGHGPVFTSVFSARRQEEYRADFVLVSRRCLSSPLDADIFKFHYLLGADWRLCCKRLKIDKGNFFHSAYRIEARLGRVFAELLPYPLFPFDSYFQGGGGYKFAASEPKKNVPEPVRAPLDNPLSMVVGL